MNPDLSRVPTLRFILILAALALPAAGSLAMDFQEMLAQAEQNDARTQALSAVLANTLLAIERAGLAPGFQMKLSTGEVRLGYSFKPENDDPPWLLSVEPSGSLLLGRRTETEIGVQLPLALGFGDGTEPAALPKVKIRQPLDKLRGGEKFTKVQERQNRYAAEKARIDVLNRVSEVERSLLGQLALLVELEQAGKELERKLAEARDTLAQARDLKSFAEGSVQQRRTEFAVSKLERELAIHRQRRANAWSALERSVGKPVDSLPAELPAPVLVLPGDEGAERNPEVYLASLSEQVESLRLEEFRQPAKPRFFLGGAVDSRYSEAKDRIYRTVGGTLEGVYDDFTVTAGMGGVVETGSLFLSAGFSWSYKDRKIEDLNRQERENSLAVSRWNLAAARAAYTAAREVLALDIEELELRRRNLEEDRAILDLRLAEASRWLEQGFSTPREVETLRWERELFDYEARTLLLDRLQVRSRLEQLAGAESAP